jgi:predicted enzyme related to lactoylglutathione lyase
VIQSISALGLPALPGGTVFVEATAQSPESLTLSYAWSLAPTTWVVSGGSGSPNVTITAPMAYGETGIATVTVTDSEGGVATGKVGLSTIQDNRRWRGPTVIETDDAGDAQYPQVAMDPMGNAIAVWYQSDGTRDNIWANRFDGSGWGSAQLIETDDAGDAQYPQVAVDPRGNAIAVWLQWDGTRFNNWANRFDGSAWGSAQLIETDDTGRTWEPQVAMDPVGNAIAVWHQWDGTRDNIWANRFDGSGWGSAHLIETDYAGGAWRPEVAVNPMGSVIAVWVQSDGTRINVWANRFD